MGRKGTPGTGTDFACSHGVRESPAHDVAAVPVDDGREVHMTSAYLDIGDVCGPHLVGKEDGFAMEQVGEPLGVL